MGKSSKTQKSPLQTVAEISSVDENTPLLTDEIGGNNGAFYATYGESTSSASSDIENPTTSEDPVRPKVWATLSVLLIGVFMSQAATTLVLATYGSISSEFNDLESGSWLLSSFVLAQCCAQPLYGKLSDIFGRKVCLQVSYVLFSLGTLGSGLGQTMAQIISSRAVQGAGAAGMVCMVSILITDLVPMHEVASIRSYVNVVQTVGRSCGGAVGGFLAETMGWRWTFICQLPFVVVAIGLVHWRLHLTEKPHLSRHHEQSVWAKLKRIDFIGALFLSLTILAFCVILDVGGQKVAWDSPVLIGIAGGGVFSAIAFVLSTKYWAAEPIFPLHLLTHYVVVTSYSGLALQNVMQMALMMAIPMYFQVVQNVSTAAAGAYMVPSILGNTVGALLTGYWIKRTGRCKPAIVLAPISSILVFVLCLATWKGDNAIPIIRSLVTFPGGFATGVAHSALFVALTAGVAEEDIAIAGSGLYLSGNIGAVLGSSAPSAVYQTTLRSGLADALAGRSDMQEILDKALSNIEYIQQVSRELRELMIPAYVNSFHMVFITGLGCAGLSLIIACISREQRLKLSGA